MVIDEQVLKFNEIKNKSNYLKECLWLPKVKGWFRFT